MSDIGIVPISQTPGTGYDSAVISSGGSDDTWRKTRRHPTRRRQTHLAGQTRDHASRDRRSARIGYHGSRHQSRRPAAGFALKNAFGQEVRSSELLAKGPLVLTVFR